MVIVFIVVVVENVRVVVVMIMIVMDVMTIVMMINVVVIPTVRIGSIEACNVKEIGVASRIAIAGSWVRAENVNESLVNDKTIINIPFRSCLRFKNASLPNPRRISTVFAILGQFILLLQRQEFCVVENREANGDHNENNLYFDSPKYCECMQTAKSP